MAPGDRPFLSVVIPAYDEASNIRAGSLERVSDYLAIQDYTYEVVVVDDGSEDDTASLAEAFAHRQPSFRVFCRSRRQSARIDGGDAVCPWRVCAFL